MAKRGRPKKEKAAIDLGTNETRAKLKGNTPFWATIEDNLMRIAIERIKDAYLLIVESGIIIAFKYQDSAISGGLKPDYSELEKIKIEEYKAWRDELKRYSMKADIYVNHILYDDYLFDKKGFLYAIDIYCRVAGMRVTQAA